MAKVIEHKKFVCSDAEANSNKFWEYIYHDDNTVVIKYGRVGSTCNESQPKYMKRNELDSLIRSKLKTRPNKPPYREIQVLSETTISSKSFTKEIIKEKALKELSSDPDIQKLVERLVEANKHELYEASGGQIILNTSSGVISTPVGIITKDSISKARISLDNLCPYIKNKNFTNSDFIKELNNYLMLVPQKVGHSKGWHLDFFNKGDISIQRQSSLLDQLDASADISFSTKDDGKSLFSTKLEKLIDQKEIDRITKYFLETINGKHESKNLRPKAFYKVHHNLAEENYNKDGAKLGNIMQLWHGTRIFNVLSILKNSLFCPPKSGTFNVTGRLFGDGIYGSDQSTKALNYSYGFWDGKKRDTNCFMFLVDFAMGEMYTPKSSYETLPKRGYDSTFAKANISGVLNNEMIVYRNSQVNPKFLIEFE